MTQQIRKKKRKGPSQEKFLRANYWSKSYEMKCTISRDVWLHAASWTVAPSQLDVPPWISSPKGLKTLLSERQVTKKWRQKCGPRKWHFSNWKKRKLRGEQQVKVELTAAFRPPGTAGIKLSSACGGKNKLLQLSREAINFYFKNDFEKEIFKLFGIFSKKILVYF